MTQNFYAVGNDTIENIEKINTSSNKIDLRFNREYKQDIGPSIVIDDREIFIYEIQRMAREITELRELIKWHIYTTEKPEKNCYYDVLYIDIYKEEGKVEAGGIAKYDTDEVWRIGTRVVEVILWKQVAEIPINIRMTDIGHIDVPCSLGGKCSNCKYGETGTEEEYYACFWLLL